MVGMSFKIFDGHNGLMETLYSKENLLKYIMSVMPTSLTREDYLSMFPRAMVAGFVKTDKEIQVKGIQIYAYRCVINIVLATCLVYLY
jgi:hypothetical protein